MVWMWVWSLFFAPTLGITNSIAMFHLGKETGKEDADERTRFQGISKNFNIGWAVVAIGSIAGLLATGNFMGAPISRVASTSRGESVTDAARCQDVTRFGRIKFNFDSQPSNMHINNSTICELVITPNLFE